MLPLSLLLVETGLGFSQDLEGGILLLVVDGCVLFQTVKWLKFFVVELVLAPPLVLGVKAVDLVRAHIAAHRLYHGLVGWTLGTLSTLLLWPAVAISRTELWITSLMGLMSLLPAWAVFLPERSCPDRWGWPCFGFGLGVGLSSVVVATVVDAARFFLWLFIVSGTSLLLLICMYLATLWEDTSYKIL